MYITPDLIGDSQPDFQDEITLHFLDQLEFAKIVNILTQQGGQVFIYDCEVLMANDFLVNARAAIYKPQYKCSVK